VSITLRKRAERQAYSIRRKEFSAFLLARRLIRWQSGIGALHRIGPTICPQSPFSPRFAANG
jgi:hypothetical protein